MNQILSYLTKLRRFSLPLKLFFMFSAITLTLGFVRVAYDIYQQPSILLFFLAGLILVFVFPIGGL